jgi:predicted HAD superfamily phosphohydrolase YqeG
MYRKIFHTLGVKPHETAVIGDDITLDIANPKRLGARTIHINRETSQHHEPADYSVHDLLEAMNTIKTRKNTQTSPHETESPKNNNHSHRIAKPPKILIPTQQHAKEK